jgi:type II secretory pathway component GspD/PulD (secretin)
MRGLPFALLLCAGALAVSLPSAADSSWRTQVVSPKFVSPEDLAAALGARDIGGRLLVTWGDGENRHEVTLRRNDAANRLVLDGTRDDVDLLAAQIEAFDVAPRQIALEARIIEVDTDKARDLGLDWDRISVSLTANFGRDVIGRSTTQTQRSGDPPIQYRNEQTLQDRNMTDSERAAAAFTSQLHLLESNGAATYRDAPRILTLNNRPATILDGDRTTYVTRYAAYNNLFETQTMDSGLRLKVTPSLGESGYLRLELQAELTSLSGNISGSPVKTGQIVENTVMAKDGETIVLGGFTRTADEHSRRDFPLLGRILPWLFSRDIVRQSHHESLIVITPHVVDLESKLDPHDNQMLEHK